MGREMKGRGAGNDGLQGGKSWVRMRELKGQGAGNEGSGDGK